MAYKRIAFTSAVVAMVLLSTSTVLILNEPGTNGGTVEEIKPFATQTIEIPADQVSATYDELKNIFESGNILYLFLDETGSLAYEFIETIDGGRTEIVELWNGWRIYLSSEVIQGALLAGDTVTFIAGFCAISNPAVLAALAIVGTALLAANYFMYGADLMDPDGYNGLFFDVTYKEKLKIWGITITYPHPLSITNGDLQ